MNRSQDLSLVLSFLAVLGGQGCGEDHTEGVATATVAPARPATTTPTESPTALPPTAAPASHVIDRATSSVGFTAAKVTASHDGSFTDFSGTVDLPGSDPTAGRVSVTIQMDSLVIEPARLSGHLRTPDLLDVARFPTAVFESTSVAAGSTATVGGATATHTIVGNFTLHGQTRALTFPATITIDGDVVSARAEFAINRQDFGIVYPGMPDDLIRDEVVIRFDIHARRP